MMPRTILVVPCFNEADRLDEPELARFVGQSGHELILVDDGSTDATLPQLRRLAQTIGSAAQVVALAQNRGKGEAVRTGLLHALDMGAEVVGYFDADLATPVAEVARLVGELVQSDLDGVIGSRVAHLGADIERKPLRHYFGRVFATGAAITLGTRVYDTQCGAKVFRAREPLRAALSQPFSSRWAFDVELLGRLFACGARVIECPLREWKDVKGSKISPVAMVHASLELAKIYVRLRAFRRRHA
jgi:dolichyl-phosphate beta-glucosyltransferase